MEIRSVREHAGERGQYTTSEAVVMAVAAAKGVEEDELEVQLYDVVDPDCLNRLFGPRFDDTPRSAGRVCFTMAGVDVTVEASGRVTAAAADAA